MSKKLTGFGLLAVALTMACSDSADPLLDSAVDQADVAPNRVFQPLAWSANETPQFSAVGVLADGPRQPEDGPMASSPPPLDNYQVSFWALKDEDRTIQINWYEKSDLGIAMHPYLRFTVPEDALDKSPDGVTYAHGDSVLITVTIDPSAMVAQFEPSGLQFKDNDNSAILQYWYTGAGGDFDGDGSVTSADLIIEQNLLGLWTTQNAVLGWSQLWAEQSLSGDWFRAGVSHFSGFAVGY